MRKVYDPEPVPPTKDLVPPGTFHGPEPEPPETVSSK